MGYSPWGHRELDEIWQLNNNNWLKQLSSSSNNNLSLLLIFWEAHRTQKTLTHVLSLCNSSVDMCPVQFRGQEKKSTVVWLEGLLSALVLKPTPFSCSSRLDLNGRENLPSFSEILCTELWAPGGSASGPQRGANPGALGTVPAVEWRLGFLTSQELRLRGKSVPQRYAFVRL